METLLCILEQMDDTIMWEKEESLIDDRILDSFKVILLISELEDAFHVEIRAEELRPENLNYVNAIWSMIQRLQE